MKKAPHRACQRPGHSEHERQVMAGEKRSGDEREAEHGSEEHQPQRRARDSRPRELPPPAQAGTEQQRGAQPAE